MLPCFCLLLRVPPAEERLLQGLIEREEHTDLALREKSYNCYNEKRKRGKKEREREREGDGKGEG